LLASEQLTGDPRQIDGLIEGSITALRDNDFYRHAPIIAIPEGMSNDAWYWQRSYFSKHPNICTMCECGRDSHGHRYGVPKTDQTTNDMRLTLSVLMASGLVAFASDFIAITTPFGQQNHTSSTLQSMLIQQLREHRDKKDSDKSRGPNDLAITTMMAPYWMNKFFQSDNPGYAAFKRGLDLMDVWAPPREP